jgi:thiosulfate reductase cytochrome b subunit
MPMRKRVYIGVIVLVVLLLTIAGLVVRSPAATVRTLFGPRPSF